MVSSFVDEIDKSGTAVPSFWRSSGGKGASHGAISVDQCIGNRRISLVDRHGRRPRRHTKYRPEFRFQKLQLDSNKGRK
jgi:hypothetical protein